MLPSETETLMFNEAASSASVIAAQFDRNQERVRALAQGDAAALEAFIAQQKALLEQTPDKP